MSTRYSCKNVKKIQKGGKILGKGRDGCAVIPPYMCSQSMSALNKVSKLINITDVSKEQHDDYLKEYESGKIFRKGDPNFHYFLPGIDKCTIDDSMNIPVELKKDIKKCGYKKPGRITYLLNIIMKKGQDFDKITGSLSEKNFLKSLGYILTGAEKAVYDLKVLLLDIKGPNLLYSSDDNDDKIYPVFIDFSNDFVIKDKNDFSTFIRNFSSGLPYYDTWSFEICAMFLAKYEKTRLRVKIRKDVKMMKLFNQIKKYRNIDLLEKNGRILLNKTLDYVNRQIATSAGIKELFDKIMVYSIGKTYYNSTEGTKLDNTKINKILYKMMEEDPEIRPTINEVLKMLSQHITYVNRNNMLISLKPGKQAKFIKKRRSKKVQQLPPSQRLGLAIKKKVVKKKVVKKKVKKRSKSVSKSVSRDCMKMTVKEIKMSKKYKSLPKSAGKSKLKKKELCDLLQKKQQKVIQRKVIQGSINTECEKWFKNPLRNPKTNRKIKLNGPTYKKIEKKCKK